MPKSLTASGNMIVHSATVTREGSAKQRRTYSLELKCRFIKAYDEALKLNAETPLTTVAGRQEFLFPRNVASRTWNDREKILAIVRQKPRMKELTKIYPRRLEMVEEALYRAIQDEFSKGL
jgi:hypothetical protein